MGVIGGHDHDGVFSLILLRWFNHLQVDQGSVAAAAHIQSEVERWQFWASGFMQEQGWIICRTSIVAMAGVPPILIFSLWTSVVSLV